MLDGGYVVSNGNNCTTNITNGFTHFVTNGNGNRIITTGKNIIDSKGIDNEIVMLGDHIFLGKRTVLQLSVQEKKRWLSVMAN